MSSDLEGAELSLSPDRISVYACFISLTAEKEDLSAIGINFPRRNTKRLEFFKNAYRNVRKVNFDKRSTQNEFCFETSILCSRRSA